MKNLLLTLVTFSVLLLIGCQENSITNPVTSKSDKILPIASNGTLTLEQMLVDPYNIKNSYYLVSGVIGYNIVILENPSLSNPQNSAIINLTFDAQITNFCSVCEPIIIPGSEVKMFIKTTGQISFGSQGSNFLLKSFPVPERDDGMKVMCNFIITSNGEISLSSMWLELNDVHLTNNETN